MKHDALTGLPVHHHVPAYLGGATETRLGVFFDVDGLIWMNDTFGHVGGDEALVRVASTLERVAREYASAAFRIGGDEFLFVLPPPAARGEAIELARVVFEEVSYLQIEYTRRDAPTRTHLALNAVVGSVAPALAHRIADVRRWIADEIWRAKQGDAHRVEVVADTGERLPPWAAGQG